MVARVAIIVLMSIMLVITGIDIVGGSYVDQTGVVDGHNTYITMECIAKDYQGNCTAHVPETHYQLVVSHGDEVTVAEVSLWSYYSYQNGDRVRVTFWRGGLVGAKWFVGVSAPGEDW